MAKTTNGTTQRKTRTAKSAASSPDPMNQKGTEALISGMENRTSESDLERARDKAFDAMEAPTRRKRVSLAREALAISPLCTDAFVILAAEAASPEEALALYRQGVDAGTQAVGESAFREDVGHFWGLLETRPYMRARHGLARTLWELGDRDEAVTHYQEMLRLNPNDNQGIRYSLVGALLELDRDKEAAELLERYGDDASAVWAWSGALLSFRQNGDSAGSRDALARAVEINRHVPEYLLARKALPRTVPEFIGLGDQNEAIAYVHDADLTWTLTDGAKGWVMSVLMGASRPRGRRQLDEALSTEADRIDAAVLALLFLGLHEGYRSWKSFDWDAMNRLHEKGLISDPVSRAKSVMFSEEGLQLAKEMYEFLFIEQPTAKP